MQAGAGVGAGSTSGVEEAKAALRVRMRAARAAITPAERERLARAVEAHLFRMPEVGRARQVLLFYSFGSELPTSAMAERLLREGHRLLLPYLDDDGMEAALVEPGDPLVHTDYGPKEPGRRVAVDPSSVDLVLTPGLAFDRRGNRLGYGGGHYDRYLARLQPSARRIGIGFSIQVVPSLPAGPGDEPLDAVVTEDGPFECGPTGGEGESPNL